MNRNQNTVKLLHTLRGAVDEALANSANVLAAMGGLEDAGFCPSLCFHVALPEKIEPPSVELITLDEGPMLTASDESFLRTLGIAAPIV